MFAPRFAAGSAVRSAVLSKAAAAPQASSRVRGFSLYAPIRAWWATKMKSIGAAASAPDAAPSAAQPPSPPSTPLRPRIKYSDDVPASKTAESKARKETASAATVPRRPAPRSSMPADRAAIKPPPSSSLAKPVAALSSRPPTQLRQSRLAPRESRKPQAAAQAPQAAAPATTPTATLDPNTLFFDYEPYPGPELKPYAVAAAAASDLPPVALPQAALTRPTSAAPSAGPARLPAPLPEFTPELRARFETGLCAGARPSDAALSLELRQLLSQEVPSAAHSRAHRDAGRALCQTLQERWPEAMVSQFGSSASGLSLKAADVDVCIVFAQRRAPAAAQPEGAADPTEEPEADMHRQRKFVPEALRALRKSGEFSVLSSVLRARVPVIHLKHRRTGVKCDLAIGNELGVLNTSLLATYARLDERARELMLCVKVWAKRKQVSDASLGFLSSYTWVVLSICFLQNLPSSLGPGLCPNLQDGKLLAPDVERTIRGHRVSFCADVERAKPLVPANPVELGTLFRCFFPWFALLDGGARQLSLQSATLPKPASVPAWQLCIQDPFELDHDLGALAP
jgi:hypothetical protein